MSSTINSSATCWALWVGCFERVGQDGRLDFRGDPVRMRPLRARHPVDQALGAVHWKLRRIS